MADRGTERWLVEVDGERFEVSKRPDGTPDAAWISGPNPGYGLSVFPPMVFVRGEHVDVDPVDPEQRLPEELRTFLASIDPATGYQREL